MRTMRVVVVDVVRENSFEVVAVEDQEPIEALTADAPDPTFGEGVRAWRAYRCPDDPDRLGTEHLVEGSSELLVAVVDQEPDRLRPAGERLDDVARCWVAHSPVGFAVTPAKFTFRVASSMNTNT